MDTTQKNEEIKVLVNVLFAEFGSLTILAESTSRVTKRSEVSLKRDRDEGIGIPVSKLGKQTGSDRVLYNIYDVAKFVVSRKSKVMS